MGEKNIYSIKIYRNLLGYTINYRVEGSPKIVMVKGVRKISFKLAYSHNHTEKVYIDTRYDNFIIL